MRERKPHTPRRTPSQDRSQSWDASQVLTVSFQRLSQAWTPSPPRVRRPRRGCGVGRGGPSLDAVKEQPDSGGVRGYVQSLESHGKRTAPQP